MATFTQALRDLLLGEEILLNLSAELSEENTATSDLVLLNIPSPEPKGVGFQKIEEVKKDMSGPGVAVLDLGAGTAYSNLLRKNNVEMLRNYAKYSTWVRAALDYHRRMLGRALFEIVPIDTQDKPSRRDKQVKAAVELLLRHPNVADESYGYLKEIAIEDYLVVGHGCIEMDLNRDLTARSLRVLDAARIGFVKKWDGTDRSVPRFCLFKDKTGSTIDRYLAHEQVFCLVNRPQSDTKLGFSHVEALHRSVLALLSGDELMIKQLLQPIPESLVNLGEGSTKAQAEEFKYQIQQVREKFAVIAGAKDPKVFRLSATVDELKVLDGQEWFVRQVAAVFGMSTAKLKLSVDTSRANTETMYADDLEMITGELTRIEELETATFINRYSYQGEINLKFSYPIMHRKDEKQQADIGKTQTGQPWASLNEARMRTGEKALDENQFPYVNEPIINMGKGVPPLPLSVYTEVIDDYRKNIGKKPEPPNDPAAGTPDDAADDTTSSDDTTSDDDSTDNNK